MYVQQEGRKYNAGTQNKPEVQAIIIGVGRALDSLTNTISTLVQKVKWLGKGMDNLELKLNKMDVCTGKVERHN